VSLFRLFAPLAVLITIVLSSIGLGAAHPLAVDPLKELMIVDRLVVEDARTLPGGPWHFGTLMREMLPAEATDAEVSAFVISWLEEWEKVTSVNGFPVTPRPRVRTSVICPWLNASTGNTDCTGVLNLNKAPMRLLAITNRIDVKKANDAGEGRFTYAVLGGPTENPNDPAQFAQSFTLLLNYALPMTAKKDAAAWAKEWHALSGLTCETGNCETYNAAMQAVTDQFTKRGLMEGKPNGNPFIELHSNEIALGSPWELRQFVLAPTERGLRMVLSTTNKTPAKELNNSKDLIDWATDNQAAILAETHSIPVPKKFLGGMSHQSFGSENKWLLAGVPEPVRLNFSKNTCNGCHREEFQTVPAIDGFYHVSPGRPAGPGRLSPWLKDTELPRRAKFIEELLARQ